MRTKFWIGCWIVMFVIQGLQLAVIDMHQQSLRNLEEVLRIHQQIFSRGHGTVTRPKEPDRDV